VKAVFPGASNTVVAPEQLDVPLDFDSMRQVGSGLGAAGFAVFDDSACMVQAAYRYSRFLFVESCGQCPACKFGTGEVTGTLRAIQAGGGFDQDLEFILVRARSSTGGQECALPTGESLLMQSLVQVFGAEFRGHLGKSCPLPRQLPLHKVVDGTRPRAVPTTTRPTTRSNPTGPSSSPPSVHADSGPGGGGVRASVGRPGASAHAEYRRRRGIERARWMLQRLLGGRPPAA
jgi:NADH-ubiquinone oxidoreductase-F iron-sulfur binding region